jgi:hypothetical protein
VENLREQVQTITQSTGLDEARVDRLVEFTENRLANEPSTLRKVMTAALTAFGALIIGTAFIGFLVVTMGVDRAFPRFLIIGITFFPAAFFCLANRREVIGITLMIIGLIASGAPASFEFDSSSTVTFILFPIWLAIVVFAILKMHNRGAVFTALLIVEVYLLVFSISQSNSAPIGLWVAVVVNAAVVLFLSFPIWSIPLRLRARIQPVLLTGATFVGTLFAFVLTFDAIYQNLSGGGRLMLTLYNVLFFAATAAMVWFGKRRESGRLIWIGGMFWFAFLFYKYYDLLWNLLHKSLVLILLGAIFIGAGYAVQRRIPDET